MPAKGPSKEGEVGTAAERFLGAEGFDGARVLVTLGSGQGNPWRHEAVRTIPYGDIPGWRPAGVAGHGGELTLCDLNGFRILVMNGRHHFYEAGSYAGILQPLQTAWDLGARLALLTNSAGSLRPRHAAGDVVLLSSSILLQGAPLPGPERTSGDVYWPQGRVALLAAASASGVELREGVLLCLAGPTYETPAEAEMARRMGADVVAMSLAPEAVLARGLGFRVLGLSLVTNMVGLRDGAPIGHDEVVMVARQSQPKLDRLLRDGLPRLDELLQDPV